MILNMQEDLGKLVIILILILPEASLWGHRMLVIKVMFLGCQCQVD